MIAFLVTVVAGFFFWPIWIVSLLIVYEALFGTGSGGVSTSATMPVRVKTSSAPIASKKLRDLKTEKSVVFSVPAVKSKPRQTDTKPSIFIPADEKLFKNSTQLTGEKMENETSNHTPNDIMEFFSLDGCLRPPPEKGWPGHEDEYSRIEAEVAVRGITALYHFTRCENLKSILSTGIRSVEDMKTDQISAVRNDEQRLDGKLNGISLSVSFPNQKMFYKYRMNNAREDWVVLKIKAEALYSLKCGYFAKNAADHRMRNLNAKDYNNYNAFSRMFGDSNDKARLGLAEYHPTDVQAEVMIFEQLPSHYIEALYFETDDVLSRWRSIVGDRRTVVEGKGRGIFGARKPFVYH